MFFRGSTAAMVIGYIVATGLVYGTALLVLLIGATRTLGRFNTVRLHHLTQGLIPLAGAGVFLGLSATTLSLLRAEHVPLWWASDLRIAILVRRELVERLACVARHAALQRAAFPARPCDGMVCHRPCGRR